MGSRGDLLAGYLGPSSLPPSAAKGKARTFGRWSKPPGSSSGLASYLLGNSVFLPPFIVRKALPGETRWGSWSVPRKGAEPDRPSFAPHGLSLLFLLSPDLAPAN